MEISLMNNLLPERVAAERYGRNTRTLRRWDAVPELGFPPPIYIRGRRYRDADALERWEKEQAARSIAAIDKRGEAAGAA
jgi:hypothetical protein